MDAVTRFEQDAGKPLSIVNFSSPFADCYSAPCRYYAFPAGPFTAIRDHGAIPFFSWGSNSQPSTDEFLLDDVIAGRHDAYLTQWATAAKEWGHPFFLRFNWEMNTPWFPWTEGYPGNQPGQYVAAWRHVHDLFVRVGASNATWVWCPNVDREHRYQPLAEVYPGDAYVDWTGLDGYSWGAPFESFTSIFKSTYDEIVGQIAPAKPMLVGETAAPEIGGSKAQWITDMFNALPVTFPRIRALLYFDKYDSGMDWPIETSPAAQQAFAAGIASARYTTNTFGTLEGSPILPP
jgi:beta-mannanase